MSSEVISLTESARLVELEEVIEKGIGTFIKVGEALSEIRDKRLYRVGFETFEEYCRVEWEMSKAYAFRAIAGAEVVKNLSPMGDTLPRNERQARPLATLPAAEQPKAWTKAVESANGAQPTAKQVETAVEEVKAETPKREPSFSPSNGMRYADLAIESLKKIQPNDTQRDKAFMSVQRWLTANYQPK